MILEGDPFKIVFFLSVPTIFMALISSLVPLTDNYFLNNYGNTDIAAAVGFCNPYINIIIAASQGLGAAGMAIIGQVNGNGTVDDVKQVARQIIIFGFIFGVILSPITIVLAEIAVKNVNNPIMEPYVFKYLSTFVFILPLVFITAIYNSFKNATGHPEATLIRIIILLILKILANTVFLKYFNMGINGALLASFTVYLFIVIWMFYDVFIKKDDLKLELSGYKPDFEIIKKILKIAIPSIFSYAIVNLGFILINNEVVKYPEYVLKAQVTSSSINSMCFQIPASVATTVTTMVSTNIGAGNIKKAKKSYYSGILLGLIMATLIFVSFYPFSEQICRLFIKNDLKVLELTARSLEIYTFSIFGFAIFMISQGAFVAMGKTIVPLIGSIFRIWLFRYLFIIITEKYLHEFSIFYGNLFSNILSGIIMVIVLFSIKWEKIK